MSESTHQLTCPYCNAALAGLLVASERVACPRCGEPVPTALRAQLAAEPASTVVASVAPVAAAVPGKTKTLAAILTVMFTMAALGGVYVWITKEDRRRNDYRTLKKRETAPQALASAGAMLGYLPSRCNLLASVHVAELLRHPASRKLLEEPRPVGLHWLLGRLDAWTGLKPSDLEQVVAGADVADQSPQVCIVVQTRRPYGSFPSTPGDGLSTPTKHRERLLYRFRLQPIGEGLLWCHSERIIVLMLRLDAAKAEDLEAIPREPRPGLDGFADPLRAAVSERVPSGSALWIAGHFEKPGPLIDLLTLTGPKSADLDVVLATRTLALSLQSQDSPTLTGHFRAADAKSAARLQQLLEERRWPQALSYKVVGPAADAAPAESLWVTLQVRGDLAGWLGTWMRLGMGKSQDK